MAQRPNLVGEQIGCYRLRNLIGTGGFAEVYLGAHIHLGTEAAIKVLHTQLTPSDIDTFRNEARTIASLRHSNIIRVLDFNVIGSTPFLVMDYAAGGTMRERYRRGTTVPLSTIIPYIQQVADALQYAHDQKLIHRDIKPENILLDQHDNVLLSDFGIALAVATSSRSQHIQDIIGTAAYMSPEQIVGRPQPASDQYSLGIVVYEWLSGTRPFEGSFAELCARQTTALPPPLRQKAPTISPEVERVVMTTLSKDPNQRFDSVRTFAAALQQAYQGVQPQIVISPHSPANITVPLSQPGPTQPFNPAHPQTTSSNKWKRVGKSKWSYTTRGPVTSSPTVVNSIVYFGSHDQNFYALDAASGQFIWSFPTKGKVLSSPTVVNSIVYFGSNDQNLYALDAASGQFIWSFPTKGKVISSPTVTNSIIYVGSHDHNLYALNTASGQLAWEFMTDGPVTSSPTVDKGVVYVGSHDCNLYARDATSGKHLWEFRTGGPVTSSPTVVKGVVYIGSYDDKLYALDTASGKPKRSFPTKGKLVSSPAATNDVVYFSSRDRNLYALDTAFLNIKWFIHTSNWFEQTLLPTIPTSSPTALSSTAGKTVIYFISDNRKLCALDADSQQIEWSFATRGRIQSSPTVVDGIAYIGSNDGNLYAIYA